jgi:tRNA(Ile2) C34 agmatinyltransferase TiaS
MKLAEGIRKHGFKRWYERELMQSHAHLVLAFLSAIGLMAAFEGLFTFVSLADKLTDLVSIVLCGTVGLWSIRRYLALLMQAEAVANQAECPDCGTYARFVLVQARDRELQVRCRQCERVWPITE